MNQVSRQLMATLLPMTLLVGCADDPVHPEPLHPVVPVTDDTGTEDTDDSDTTGDSTSTDTGPDNDLDDDGYSPPDDCNDTDPTVHPGAPDNCHDDIDQDCLDGPLDCSPVPDVVLDDADTTIVPEPIRHSTPYDNIGMSVASLGDLDGDGGSDFATIGNYDETGLYDDLFLRSYKQVWIFDGPIDKGELIVDDAAVATILGAVGEYTVYYSLAAAGDVDGDGYRDLLLGTISSCDHAVDMFLGPFAGDETIPDANWSSGCDTPRIDSAVGLDGGFDFDGDGFDDAVAGDPWATFAGFDSGSVYLIHGPPDSKTLEHAVRLDGAASDLGRGRSVAGLGDVDGDGLDDFATGAYAGPVFVYTGGALSGDLASDDAAYAYYENPTAEAFLGAVADGGDFNADGYGDLLVTGTQTVEGQDGLAFMVTGPMKESGEIDTLALATFHGDTDYWNWGNDGSADVNGDGSSDILIAAETFSEGTDLAVEYLFYGPLTGVVDASEARCRMFGGAGMLGPVFSTAAFIGDQYGDGSPDVVIGDWVNGGKLWVVSSEHL